MKEPKISVIIPVFNVENHLKKCLDSVIGQTYQNLEIILIDDGSKDASGAICDAYAEKEPRIICVHQENGGVSKARNRGIEIATGDYYHFLDSDDYIDLDTYAYLLSQMKKNHAEAIGFGYYVTFPEREIAHGRAPEHCGVRDTKGAIYEHLFSNNDYLCTKLLPALAVKSQRFHEDIFRDEDTLFGTEAFNKIKTAVFVERPLLHYVQSEESACRGVFRPNQLSAVKVIPIMEPFLQDNYPEFLTRWRIGYLHLMVMLYGDMFLDQREYEQEQKQIHQVFCELYHKVPKKEIQRQSVKIKFLLFYRAPKLFCRIHKTIHRF